MIAFLVFFSLQLASAEGPQKAPAPGASVSASTPAAAPAEKPQIAVVQGGGATVYSAADFDSPVLIQLKATQKVRVSLKTYPGVGGFGSFFKVFFKHNRVGYVADVEVVPEYTQVGKRKRTEKNPAYKEFQDEQSERDPIFFTRYIGLTLGTVGYAEKIQGSTFKTQALIYGLRMTGPLLDGPPLDVNVLMHWGSPSYYSSLTGSSPGSGYFVLSDVQLMFPVFETRNNLITLGFGPLLAYASFRMTIQNTYFDSQELRLGATINAGYSHRFGKYLGKIDAKYFFEKTQYFSYTGSFMVEF